MSLSDGHQHVLIYRPALWAFGVGGTVESRLKDKPGVDVGPWLCNVFCQNACDLHGRKAALRSGRMR